jgi:aspartyl aminopeptidase
VQRVNAAMGTDPSGLHPDLYAASICKSFLFSVDQAHAQHPNYMGKHEKNHAPRMNAGVVVKSNSNQRYCTNAATGFLIRELTRKAGITPLQEFVVRNDCPCGSTIGPILSSKTGIRTVDAGMPQLSMHSCREVMGIVDRKLLQFANFKMNCYSYPPPPSIIVVLSIPVTNCYELFLAFFKHFREVDVCLEC